MVVHLGTIHHVLSVAGVDPVGGVDHTVVEGHHHRGGLEDRTGFQKVGHGVVAALTVDAVAAFLQVDDGFHVAGGHFHDDGHAHFAVDEFQLFLDGFLGDVLHLDVEGGHDVITVRGFHIHKVEVFVHHLPFVGDALLAAQQTVIGEFQSETGTVFRSVHIADGAVGEGAERAPAGIVLLIMETAAELGHVEDGQCLHSLEGVVVHTLGPDGPVLAHFLMSFLKVALELLHRFLGEDLVQAHADAVYFLVPEGVFLLAAHLEVHIHLVFRQRTGHQFTVVAEDVAAVGRHDQRVKFLLLCHFHPIVVLDGHDIGGLQDNGDAQQGHDGGDEGVAGDDIVVVESAHGGIRD